ncbi:hypothetical protein D3C76_514580 [compost metagenome]
MVAEQAEQPEAGAQHHQAEQGAQAPHPAARLRQPERQARDGGDEQPGQAHAHPQGGKDEPELAQRRPEGKGDRSAEEGGGAGGGQQGGKAALQEVTPQALAAAGGQAGIEVARQPQLEQPQQVGAEQRRHHHHEADKPDALELDPPADRPLGGAQQGAHQCQRPEGDQNAGTGRQELQAHRAALPALELQHGSQLEGQHRQHAGHQIENEPPQQRGSQQPEQRAAAARQGQGLTYADLALPGLLAARQHQPEWLMTDIGGIPLPAIADRNAGDQGVALHLQAGLAKFGPLKALEEHLGILPALGVVCGQLQLVLPVARLEGHSVRHGLWQGAHRLRIGKVEPVRGSAVQRQGEGVVGQDADVAASREAQGTRQRLAAAAGEADGKADVPLVALGRDAADVKPSGHWPVPLRRRFGLIPEDLGGYAAFPRVLPIGFPAGFKLQVEQHPGGGGIPGVGLQPHLGVIVLGAGEPAGVAGQSHGLPQQTAQQQGGLDDV